MAYKAYIYDYGACGDSSPPPQPIRPYRAYSAKEHR